MTICWCILYTKQVLNCFENIRNVCATGLCVGEGGLRPLSPSDTPPNDGVGVTAEERKSEQRTEQRDSEREREREIDNGRGCCCCSCGDDSWEQLLYIYRARELDVSGTSQKSRT